MWIPVIALWGCEKDGVYLRKKSQIKTGDDLRPEYDLTRLKGGLKGKYAKLYAQGSNVVALDPDVAKVFRTSKAVNRSLRALIEVVHLKG